jgi:hypothetical protein
MSELSIERVVIAADRERVRQLTEENLAASRLRPEQIRDTIARLEEERDTSRDPRCRHNAKKILLELYKWQTDRDLPVAQLVQQEHTVHTVDHVTIEIIDKAPPPGIPNKPPPSVQNVGICTLPIENNVLEETKEW